MLVLFALCFPTNQLIVIKTYGYWSGNKKNPNKSYTLQLLNRFYSILLIGKVTAVFRLYHSEENNCRFRVY